MATPSTDQRPQQPQIGDGEIVGEDRAKQGRSGRRILAILAASLALLLVAFLVTFLTNPPGVGQEQGGQQRTDDASAAAAFNAPEPSPKQPPPR